MFNFALSYPLKKSTKKRILPNLQVNKLELIMLIALLDGLLLIHTLNNSSTYVVGYLDSTYVVGHLDST